MAASAFVRKAVIPHTSEGGSAALKRPLRSSGVGLARTAGSAGRGGGSQGGGE